jgi:uncharacterized protein (UPF0261 family)
MSDKTILVIGTWDTKEDELGYICGRIAALGGRALAMDVSVLGEPSRAPDISKRDVARAAGRRIEDAMNAGDENKAMQIMARGAAALTAELHAQGRIDGMVGLGGTMGTDLVLDCCQALPMGVPKYVVSTVAFSPLIPADRLSPDIQMILWAGGLYGLNSVCRSSLSQAAGAVLGAAQAVEPPRRDRPVIGMTSLGSSCLSYMTHLKAPLEERGFEVAVFHATGMGGMAFEALARQGYFACALDLALPELGNLMVGSVAHAGADRLTNAGKRGIPQIVAPGCTDLIDFAGWQPGAGTLPGTTPSHAHNRLSEFDSFWNRTSGAKWRGRCAGSWKRRHGADRRSCCPRAGCHEWDRPGADLQRPGRAGGVSCDEMEKACPDECRATGTRHAYQ